MANFNIDYLVVAGGGAGGRDGGRGGGGGAGGLLTSIGQTPLTFSAGTQYVLTVGQGGLGSTSVINNGDDSELNGPDITLITATGGGRGGGGPNTGGQNRSGSAGGSGGGAIAYYSGGNPGTGNTPATTPSQGNNGGDALSTSQYGAGGGGGAGAAGSNGSGHNGGTGGVGITNSITVASGTGPYYAGGGAGGGTGGNVSGGSGGGGSFNNSTGIGSSGTNGLGGGGAGGGMASTSASGGSGVIILRYTTSDIDSYTTTGLTPTETTVGTDTVLSFTTVGAGTITFTTPIPPFNPTKVTNPVTGFNSATEDGLKLPSGTNANQPTGAEGMIRNNTSQTTGGSVTAIEHHNGTTWKYFAATESALPTVTLTNSWRAWDTASFVNGGTSCTDVTGGLVLGPYSSGSPGAFFYGSFNNVAGNKYWVMNGGGSHGRRAGFNRPTEFTVSYWGNKPNNPGFNSERAIWSFNVNGANSIRLARRNNANTQSLRIYSGNSAIATFADGINLNTWYNITLTFSANTVKTYIGVQGGSATTLVNETTIGGTFPTGISNASNGTGFWIATNSGYTDWLTDSWSGLNIYDGVARQAEIDTIVSNGYQQ